MSDEKKYLRFKPVNDVLLMREVVAKQPDGKEAWDEVVRNVNSAIDGQQPGQSVTLYSRVNKHLRLDKIAIKGFSPEISSFVPFLPTVENPHKSLHGKCPIFTKIQNGGQPT